MKLARRQWWLWGLAALLLCFVALNFVAYRQAWAMTHFVNGGSKTQPPEHLTWWQRAAVIATGVRLPKPLNTVTTLTTAEVMTRDGVKLELWRMPVQDAKTVVVMFHGYGCAKSMMLPEAAVLHDLGWEVVMTDFRGSGGSAGDVTTIGWREALDVAAVVEWTRRELPGRRLVLFGQSMGAVAALRSVATEGVQPDAMILECPFETLLNTVRQRFRAMGLPVWPSAELLVFWGGRQMAMNGFRHDATVYAKAVRCPVLLLWGEQDARVRREEVERVAVALGGNVQFVPLPGVGHQSYCRTVPSVYEQTLRTWAEAHDVLGN